MLNLGPNLKIYLSCQLIDMRKGINGLSILASNVISKNKNHDTKNQDIKNHKSVSNISTGAMFVFRGKRSDKLKILWWDGQGFCLFYKCLDQGKFIWPTAINGDIDRNIRVTKAQLSMLIEGIDWRNPTWSNPPKYLA
jgi:transposase